MIIATYTSTGIVPPKFRRIYEGQELTALYMDGTKAVVVVRDGKLYRK